MTSNLERGGAVKLTGKQRESKNHKLKEER